MNGHGMMARASARTFRRLGPAMPKPLPSVSSLQFAREGSSRVSDKFSKTIGADAIPAERDRRLLFKKIGSGNSDRVKLPVFCDKSFDNIVRGAARI